MDLLFIPTGTPGLRPGLMNGVASRLKRSYETVVDYVNTTGPEKESVPKPGRRRF